MATNRKRDYIETTIPESATLTSDIAPSAEAMKARAAVLHRMDERVKIDADPADVLRALLATPPQP